MLNSQETIQTIVRETTIRLQDLLRHGIEEQRHILIECEDLLEEYYYSDIRDSKAYKSYFAELKNVAGPALYWFEVVSDHSSVDVYDALEKYKQTESARATPALRNTRESTSKILYVGKVKKQLWGRLIQHLGFYKVPATQGLQLFHWAKQLGISLTFNYISFSEELADIMPLIEYAFAKHYQPLVGKHK